jgi:hypothetical protein
MWIKKTLICFVFSNRAIHAFRTLWTVLEKEELEGEHTGAFLNKMICSSSAVLIAEFDRSKSHSDSGILTGSFPNTSRMTSTSCYLSISGFMNGLTVVLTLA